MLSGRRRGALWRGNDVESYWFVGRSCTLGSNILVMLGFGVACGCISENGAGELMFRMIEGKACTLGSDVTSGL